MTGTPAYRRQLKFGVFLLPSGQHVGAWRLPDSPDRAGVNYPFVQALVQRCEQALLDFIFLADVDGMVQTKWDAVARDAAAFQFEPMTLLSALASATAQIGLVGSVSTEYNAPFHVARKFASLEQISGGRAGWNVVTSVWAHVAANFGMAPHREHDDRYERAAEFLEVAEGLWDSWADDAIVADRTSGIFVDVDRLHVLDHRGDFFASAGPLPMPRSPQGRPVIVQAGSSEPGRAMAARSAEVVFTAQSDLAAAKAFYADVKGRLGAHDRTRESLLVMPGMMPIVGRTEEEAQEKFRRLADLLDPQVALSYVSRFTDADLSGLELDDALPPLPEIDGHTSRKNLIVDNARRHGWTIRQLYEWFGVSRGHFCVVGTAEQVADQLALWFDEEACDGFNLMFANLPGGLDDFASLVVPELQRRGLFRTAYEGTTLREKLGLARPKNMFFD